MNLKLTEQQAKLIFRLLTKDTEKQKTIIESQSKISNTKSGRQKSLNINENLQKNIFALLQESDLI
jgi:hypothetical protein